jgi:hypothetical protein
MPDTTNVEQQSRHIEDLIGKLEASADPASLAAARELMQAVMDLHGAALERVLEIVSSAGAPGRQILEKLGRDELAGSLFLLYGIHPLSVETRVNAALDKLRGANRLKPIDIELVGIQDGVARLHIHGKGPGRVSDPGALKAAAEQALREAAPDLLQVIIEGADEFVFVPLEMLTGHNNGTAKGVAHGPAAI